MIRFILLWNTVVYICSNNLDAIWGREVGGGQLEKEHGGNAVLWSRSQNFWPDLLFHLKAVITGTHKAEVGAGADNFFDNRSRSRSWSRNK